MADLNETVQLLTATIIQMNETINDLQKQMDDNQDWSIETQNNLYLIITGALVFFMQTGFGMLEAGSVSSEHASTVILKNILDAGVSALCYWAVGFAFAFGDKAHNGFIGSGYYFLSDMPSETRSMPYWFFQITFCATAATIVSGAVAERIRVQGYLLHTAFMSAFVYPVVSHWMWSSDGWLSISNEDRLFGTGAIDFAGDAAVHMVGGMAALIGAKMVGYRGQYSPPNAKETNKPRFQQVSGKWIVNDLPASSGLLACLGCFILWTGWYGFNCGSVIAIYGQTNTAGRVAVNTTLAAASGSLGAIVYGRVERRNNEEKYALNDAINGVLAGLVAITGPCAVVEPWAAVVIGLVGSVAYRGGSRLLLHPKIMIDDPVEAAPVHLCCGTWGLLAVGIFAKNKYIEEAFGVHGEEFNGIIYGQGRLFACQLVTILVVGAWTAFWSSLIFAVFVFVDRNRSGEDLLFLEKGGHIDKTGFGASAVNVVIDEDEQEMDEEVGRKVNNKSDESIQLPGNTSRERKSFKSSSVSSSPNTSNTKIKPAAAYSSSDDSDSSDVRI